jgi:hypothetical protein
VNVAHWGEGNNKGIQWGRIGGIQCVCGGGGDNEQEYSVGKNSLRGLGGGGGIMNKSIQWGRTASVGWGGGGDNEQEYSVGKNSQYSVLREGDNNCRVLMSMAV